MYAILLWFGLLAYCGIEAIRYHSKPHGASCEKGKLNGCVCDLRRTNCNCAADNGRNLDPRNLGGRTGLEIITIHSGE